MCDRRKWRQWFSEENDHVLDTARPGQTSTATGEESMRHPEKRIQANRRLTVMRSPHLESDIRQLTKLFTSHSAISGKKPDACATNDPVTHGLKSGASPKLTSEG
ncbi:hypothetical protein AVEN_109935-1 [Araneus ventricosus]|uniref:Uncharacterized protein n=1 Tax=Araneus ventricosus TaxID=182803 RepID=A0A4Y2UCW4_ARAVE|nr:hypothetical protein AVEN_109935-1 [Araneus ventricosus]